MARKKRVKKVTLSELQSYIQGAIDLNDEEWHPDKKQWENIVEMIMNVKPEPPVEKVIQQNVAQPSSQGHIPSNGGAMSNNTQPNAPTPSDSTYMPPSKLDLRSESGYKLEKTGSPTHDAATGVTKSGIKVKTPDIDEPVYDTPFT